jgi:hypothetical protein
MSNIIELKSRVPAMSAEAVANVRRLENCIRQLPQAPISTHHVLHGGQYTRTIMIPEGVVLTGALINVPTTLVICGDCTVYIGEESVRVQGYNVFAASAGRKQAFMAHSNTFVTMTFATNATTVEQAEDQFTDEAALLMSRGPDAENHILITGE